MSGRHVPIITLTTDFGTQDHYVGSVKAAILSVAGDIRIVDITHEIPAHDVVQAALILRNVFNEFPRDTVHIAVTDPGVGTQRRAIVAVTENYRFVGPDNGIFSLCFEIEPPSRVIAITARHYMRAKTSPTFHARDIFAPVAAHIARGADPGNLGEAVEDPACLEQIWPATTSEGTIRARAIHIDRFGNIVLNVTRRALEGALARVGSERVTARVGRNRVERIVMTYGEAPPGVPCLLWNSASLLEIAINRQRASDVLHVSVGDAIDILPVRA
ncbi:MAG: S-adenosyl-l-methionine hydroxide adenosyltransferase family protein [Acidobacteriota bacterium]